MFRFGVDTFIWSEAFSEKDLWIIDKAAELGFEVLDIAIAFPFEFPLEAVKKRAADVGIKLVTTTTQSEDCNFLSADPTVRQNGVRTMKKLVDINVALGSPTLGGVNYAAWGYLTRKPRTQDEWNRSVDCMGEVARYAQSAGKLNICVECINRFETHFLNIAEDAVRYCKEIGLPNMKVHLDAFHMIREEESFAKAIRTCGKEYLGYFHVCESNRGIPGTGLVPWKELFRTVREVGYEGPLVIESFDPNFEILNGMCAIWRKFAESGEELAVKGLANLKRIAAEVEKEAAQ